MHFIWQVRHRIDFSPVLQQMNRGSGDTSTRLLWGWKHIYRANQPRLTYKKNKKSLFETKDSSNFQNNWIFLPLRFNNIKVKHKKHIGEGLGSFL